MCICIFQSCIDDVNQYLFLWSFPHDTLLIRIQTKTHVIDCQYMWEKRSMTFTSMKSSSNIDNNNDNNNKLHPPKTNNNKLPILMTNLILVSLWHAISLSKGQKVDIMGWRDVTCVRLLLYYDTCHHLIYDSPGLTPCDPWSQWFETIIVAAFWAFISGW